MTLIALLLQGCLMRARPGTPPLTGELHVEGNREVESRLLVKRLALTPTGRWFFGLSSAQRFEPEALPADAARVERVYRSLGYYEAKVVETRVDEHDGRADVTFVVQEGRRTVVSALLTPGLEALPAPLVEQLRNGLTLQPGVTLTEEAFDDDVARLRGRLQSEGYLRAEVTHDAEVAPEDGRARVTFTVTAGRPLHVRRLIVAGAQATSKDRIAQETELEPGQLLTPERLARARQRVSAMGIFASVRVEAGAEELPGQVPVVVTVAEAPFISRELAAGLMTDPFRWVGQVRGEWRHRNLGRGLQQLTLGAAAGYAWLPGLPQALFGGPLSSHGIVGAGKVEFVQPRVMRAPVDLAATADYSKDLLSAFSFQRAGLKLAVPLHLDAWVQGLTITPAINYDLYFDVTQNGEIPVGTTSGFATSGCGGGTTGASDRCFIGTAETRINLDRRNDPVNTRSGWYLAASAQYAGLPLSEFDFVRLTPEARGFWPVGDRSVLAARLRWGMLFKTTTGGRDLPGVARFFSGGASSVRVTGAQQLGPRDYLVQRNGDFSAGRDVACGPGVTGSCKDPYAAGVPLAVGGNRLLEGSLELRMPTPWEDVGWTLFLDGGTVANVDPQSTAPLPDVTLMRYGAGVGLRIGTPVGPVRLDVAQRLQSWTDRPVAVRVAPGLTTPGSTRPEDYAFATDCAAAGFPTSSSDGRWHQCLREGGVLSGLSFFLTVGEAF